MKGRHMTTRLYCGNLPYDTDDEQLRSTFVRFGNVVDAKVIIDRESGRSKGFGFVELDADAAETAIWELNQTNFNGRKIVVSVAREKANRGR
jgi:cold-inducible RNA-binding protein